MQKHLTMMSSFRFVLLLVLAVGSAAAFSTGGHYVRRPTTRKSTVRPIASLLLSSHKSIIKNGRAPTTLHADDGVDEPDAVDPSLLISSKDDATQQLAFVSAFGVLAVGTALCVQLWHGPGVTLLGDAYYQQIRSSIFPKAFGIIFAVVGVLHFVFVDNFAKMVPPKGTWGGLWQAPAPFQEELGIQSYEAYHSYWTGVAECLGGIWLLAAGFGLTSTDAPANLLFLLTIGVTPANLYMFTHDVTPGGAIPRLQYPFGHVARFLLQCGLLSNFWIMGHS